jgi:subfamily B ATP-binding cassette protein MsbA
MLMALMMIGMAIKSVFDFLQVYMAGSVVQLAVFDLRKLLYRHTMNLDLSHFSEKGTHDLMARFTSDMDSLTSGMRALLGKVLFEPLKAIVCLACALVFSWRLTLVTLLLFPLAAIVMGIIGRYLKRVSRRNLESMARIYKILQESFLGVRVVKAFSMERYERRRFYKETKKFYYQSMKLIRTDAVGGPVLEFMGVGAVTCALLAGSYLVMTEQTHVFGIKLTDDPIPHSMLLTFYAYIVGMCDPLRKVFSVYGRVQRGVAASERIFQCLDRKAQVAQKTKAAHLPRHCRSIRFENVSFGYDPKRLVLHGVTIEVKAGETIAVVGTTGCGKTSLINLLPRFYDPVAGKVLIDGADIRSVSLKSLRQQMGIVTQHTILFDDTIFNNIAYGNPNVSRDEVVKAAEAAYAHRFIEKLPNGYDTPIGEMGNSLSGGQRQRIALARAILRDPSILILDEATSSLDVESEALIHKALRNFTRNRTTFVVTHRLSTLDIADRIVVIDEGRVEAIGTHDQLLMQSGTYRRLQDVQAKGA